MKYLQMMFSKKFLLNLIPILGVLVILSLALSSYEIVMTYFVKNFDPINELLTPSGYRILFTTLASHAFWFSILAFVYTYIKKN